MPKALYGNCCATGGWKGGVSAGSSRSSDTSRTFVCFEARLIIEVDDGQHFESGADKKRDAYLQSLGFQVMRFWNTEVLTGRDSVYQAILTALARCAPGGAAPSSSSG